MKRAVELFVLIALLSGCHEPKPKYTDEQMQKVRAEAPYLTEKCLEKIRWGGVESLESNDDCVKRLPPARWRGLWRDDFEGSLFCPAPARECANERSSSRIWLGIDPRPAALQNVSHGGLYEIEFIGRRSVGSPMESYGYQQEIVLDRVISVKQVEAPPPEPTKAEIVADMKACEAKGTCIPDWEAINQIDDSKK